MRGEKKLIELGVSLIFGLIVFLVRELFRVIVALIIAPREIYLFIKNGKQSSVFVSDPVTVKSSDSQNKQMSSSYFPVEWNARMHEVLQFIKTKNRNPSRMALDKRERRLAEWLKRQRWRQRRGYLSANESEQISKLKRKSKC